jgi:DNA topoisomerase-3
MEGAGKMVDDEELKAAMAGRGLGTPATRAQIIENLIGEQYMHREGRELIPTAKAFSLMTLLNGLGINELTQPGIDRRLGMEARPHEKGEFTREEFMREIAEMTRHMVERAKTTTATPFPAISAC